MISWTPTTDKTNLEKLDSNDREHELEQKCDQDDVLDGGDRDNDSLDNSFESLGSIDGTQWPEHTQDPKDFENRYSSSTGAKDDGENDLENLELLRLRMAKDYRVDPR